MAKERALTLEALRVMDAIDRRGSFAAAADELGRVPSALSYTMQKLEEELDVVLFDRSGHRTKFTNVGRMLLERGRVLLEAADKLTTDAEALARGWETHLTLVTEALVPTEALFPLVDRLAAKANTQLSIITEVLAGAWERLETGRADIVIAPDMHFRSSSEINSRKLYSVMNVYVAAPNHPIHQEPEPLSEVTRVKYRGVAVADTARERPVLTVQLLDKQPRLTVTSLEDKRQALLAGLGVATMPYPFVEKILRKGGCALSARNTPAKWISLWRGAATAWAKPNHGVYAKFRSFSRNTINKIDVGPVSEAPPGFFMRRS
jgi:DNA-binding transcriptional LysR family regulator